MPFYHHLNTNLHLLISVNVGVKTFIQFTPATKKNGMVAESILKIGRICLISESAIETPTFI